MVLDNSQSFLIPRFVKTHKVWSLILVETVLFNVICFLNLYLYVNIVNHIKNIVNYFFYKNVYRNVWN